MIFDADKIVNEILTIDEFAKKLRVSRSTVVKMIKQGRIIPIRLTKAKKTHYRIDTIEIQRLKSFEVHKASIGEK